MTIRAVQFGASQSPNNAQQANGKPVEDSQFKKLGNKASEVFDRFKKSASLNGASGEGTSGEKKLKGSVGQGISRMLKKAFLRPFRGWVLTLGSLIAFPPLGLAMLGKSFVEGLTGHSSLFLKRRFKVLPYQFKVDKNPLLSKSK